MRCHIHASWGQLAVAIGRLILKHVSRPRSGLAVVPQITNLFSTKHPCGTKWTATDSTARTLLSIGLNWTNLASFPGLRDIKRDTMRLKVEC